mgnify:CR=1 FL=1
MTISRLKNIIIVSVLILALTTIIVQRQNIKRYSNYVTLLESNNKALAIQRDSNANKAIEFKSTIESLEYYNDSISRNLKETYEKLNIKDKAIKRLEYIASTALIRDSIVVKDTIFVEDYHLDTSVVNKWYNIGVKLDYPGKIEVNPKIVSEKYIVSHTSRETVNKPKKFFLWRLFQRKHNIVRVEVVEENPYITNTQTKFIEIVK